MLKDKMDTGIQTVWGWLCIAACWGLLAFVLMHFVIRYW